MVVVAVIAGGGVVMLVGILAAASVSDWNDDAESTEAARVALESISLRRDADLVSEPPSVESTPEVNTHRDGEPIVVPVVEVELATDEEPDRATGYRIAGAVLGAIHPQFADSRVRNYDIHLVYGDDSWIG